jgi:hypothetical protein
MMHGDLGRPEGGWPEGIQKKVLKDKKPLATRPGANMVPLDLAVERKKLDEKLGRPATDTQFASYLMYPKVFLDYARDRTIYGDCAILTPVFFTGWSRETRACRHRTRQDADRAIRRRLKCARRHAPGVLRVTASLAPSWLPIARRSPSARRSARWSRATPTWAPDAGHDRHGQGHRGSENRQGRSAADHGSDEDGDQRVRKPTARWPKFWPSRGCRWTRRICWWCWDDNGREFAPALA